MAISLNFIFDKNNLTSSVTNIVILIWKFKQLTNIHIHDVEFNFF